VTAPDHPSPTEYAETIDTMPSSDVARDAAADVYQGARSAVGAGGVLSPSQFESLLDEWAYLDAPD